MKRTPDVELVLREYFADDGLTAPDYVLNVVEGRIGRQRQRRSWPFPRRTTMTQIKLAAALAAAVVVAVVGYNLLPGASGPGAPSTAPTASASPSAIPTSSPVATGPVALADGILAAGRYRIQPSPDQPSLTVVADIPAGWVGYPFNAAIVSPGGGDEGVVIGFAEADGLFSDPCHWDLDDTGAQGQPGDVVVGPTVDELVEALKANTSYASSTPSPVTVGAFQGTELELQLPGDDVLSTCDWELGGDPKGLFFVFSGNHAGWYSQGPDNLWQLFIVDVDGTRLITLVSYFEGTPPADVAAARAIVESFEITP